MNKNVLYAGYGRAVITPSEPARLCGYPHPNRLHQEVKDDVCASCTALHDAEGNILLLFSVDLESVWTAGANRTRDAISAATGVARENIVLNATHCHAAPVLEREFFHSRCIEAAKEAISDLSECEIYAATRETYGLNFCRRYLAKDGTLFNYDERPVIWNFETEPDHNVYVIKFAREGKKDIVLANWAAHNDTIYGCEGKYYTLSADYVGAARTAFEKENDAFLSIHMGACGDLNPVNTPYPFYSFPGTDRYGQRLALEITESLRKMDKLEGGLIRTESTVFDLEIDHSRDNEVPACRKICEVHEAGDKAERDRLLKEANIGSVSTAYALIRKCDDYGATDPIELSCISVGDLAFAIAPYEMFNDTGVQVREGSKFPMTFVCAYSNGFQFYIPTLKGFANGGYEMVSCIYKPGSAEKVGEKFIEILDKLQN